MIPYSENSLGRAKMAVPLSVAKPDFPCSQGTILMKEKSKGLPTMQLRQALDSSMDNDSPYKFFVLAERDQLKDDLSVKKSGLQGGVKGKLW